MRAAERKIHLFLPCSQAYEMTDALKNVVELQLRHAKLSNNLSTVFDRWKVGASECQDNEFSRATCSLRRTMDTACILPCLGPVRISSVEA